MTRLNGNSERRSAGEHYRREVFDLFLADLARPAGYHVADYNPLLVKGPLVEIEFGFGGLSTFNTNYDITTVQVRSTGPLSSSEAPTVTFKLDRTRDTVVGDITAKLQKVMAKAAAYTQAGQERRAALDAADAERRRSDELIAATSARHLPGFARHGDSGRTVKVGGMYPNGDLLVSGGVRKRAGEADEVYYTVRCDDQLTPDEASIVAETYLRLRAIREARRMGFTYAGEWRVRDGKLQALVQVNAQDVTDWLTVGEAQS